MRRTAPTVLAGVAVAVGFTVATPAAADDDNNRPICRGSSFNMPAQGESVVIDVLSPRLAADPDGDPLGIIDVFGAQDGIAVVDDQGTPTDPTDDVIVYTRTEPFFGFGPAERILYSVTDGQLSSQCSANYFPSNPW